MSEDLILYESEHNAAGQPSASGQAESNEQGSGTDTKISAGKISQENIREIADKVYRLMQRDLMLERERSTRIGG